MCIRDSVNITDVYKYGVLCNNYNSLYSFFDIICTICFQTRRDIIPVSYTHLLVMCARKADEDGISIDFKTDIPENIDMDVHNLSLIHISL